MYNVVITNVRNPYGDGDFVSNGPFDSAVEAYQTLKARRRYETTRREKRLPTLKNGGYREFSLRKQNEQPDTLCQTDLK